MDKYKGLTRQDVEINQKKYGLNEIKKKKKSNFLILYLKQFNDWLVIILIIAAILSLLVDHDSLFESFIILFILFLNALIGAIQELKAFNTLEGLKKLTNHKVKVIREGKTLLIEPKYLTINDIVLLEKGNMIDADMVILECNGLYVDESILTGESISIEKKNNDHLYSGTFIVKGDVVCKVNNIGMNSKIGQIAKEITSIKEEQTPLEEKLEQIGKVIGLIAIIICLIVFIIELLLKISFTEALKSAVSLAVAAIPEGLATVVTVCLAIGVKKMANQNAIVKKLACVETLGCSNVVCTDKTGTLTENKLKVVNLYIDKLYDKKDFELIEKKYLDLFFISSKLDSFEVLDPIDVSILEMLEKLKYKEIKYNIENHKPFDSFLKYSSFEIILDGKRTLIYKGAFDVLEKKVLNKPYSHMLDASLKMMDSGCRVISIATKEKIIAIIGMQDRPRKDVISTIAMAKSAGVKTIMITGDHKNTAYAIASELNIAANMSEVITKEELDKLNDEELEKNINQYSVYARVSPFDKVRVVSALQKNNMVVAMAGDGINDSVAIKKADVGCAMGNGAEITKDCADIILTDSNYNTIIKAMKNGRGIYENIRKCTKYLLSSNIGEVLVIFIVLMISLISNVNFGIPLLSIHLLWINLITDSLPAFGLGVMNPTDDIMKNPPRKKEEHFFDKNISIDIIFMGVVIGLLSVISFFIGIRYNASYASTMAFLTLSTSQLIHSYNCAYKGSIFNKNVFRNNLLNLSFVVGVILQALVLYVDGLNALFKLKPLPIGMLFISISLSFLVLIISEIKKKIEKKKQ